MIAVVVLGFVTLAALVRAQRVTDRCAELEYAATHDPLTGLLNRAGLQAEIDRRLLDDPDSLTILYLDLDRFKIVNDTLGHDGGDQLIATIGKRIATALPDGTRAGRVGGDEFVVVTNRLAEAAVRRLAEKLSRSIGEPIEVSGRLIRVGTSCGIASGPWAATASSDALWSANMALHRAKDLGRDRVEVFTPDVRADLDERARQERLLRLAIDNGDVVPFFQPEFDAATGRLVGAEILARWVHPDGTVASAASMMLIATDANTLERLTWSIMQQSRPMIRRLAALGLPHDFRFRVNLPQRSTPRAWRDGQIKSCFTDIDLALIVIDVRESAVAIDWDHAVSVLADLKSRGARVCLADAARDGITPGNLDRLQVDELRIGRSDIADCLENPTTRAALRALSGLANELDIALSATGVETEEQSEHLADLRYSRQQGFLFAPVMTAAELEDVILIDAMNQEFDPDIA